MENMAKHTQLEVVSSLEDIHGFVESIAKTNYLFSHQTNEGVAEQIYNTNFEISPGKGLSSSLTWVGEESLKTQIQQQFAGDAHRGYTGMLIVAVPKELLDKEGSRNKAEALENTLLEGPDYGKNGNPNLVIPNKYNAGYLQGNTLYYKK